MTKAVKRSVSIVLTILMLMSMCVIGSFTGTAATTNDETVGVSYDGTTKLYLDSNGCYWWNDADAVMGVSFRGSTTTTPVAMTPVEGRTKIFEVTVPAGDYTQVVFSRHESIESAAWNSVTATLQSDRNLFVLNSGANGGSWDNFDEGATDPPVVYGPQTIYFDNTNTRCSEVYVYGWAFGLSETFEKMELVEGNIYSYTFPEEPVAGQEGFLFVNKGSWTSQQQQTVNVMLEEGKNLYTNLSGSGTTWSGTWDVYTPVTTDPTEPEPTEPEPTEPEPTEPEPTEPPAGERYMLGDVTFDDEITLEDILIMQRSMAMMTTLTQLQMTAGDVDRNGNIEIADVLEVQKYLAKMSTQYDIGKVFNDATMPTDPQPTEPQPTEPQPTEPQPTEPQPTEPEPTEPQPTEPSDSNEVTLYFSNGVSWDKVYIYAWRTSDENKNAEWPGEEMTAVGQNSFGETIYQINIDLSQYDNVIFNNGSGQQTEDIPLTSASNNMGYYCDKNVQNAQGHYGYGTYLFDPSFIV